MNMLLLRLNLRQTMHGGKVYKGLLHKSKGPSSYLLLGWFIPKKIPTKLKFCYNYWGVKSHRSLCIYYKLNSLMFIAGTGCLHHCYKPSRLVTLMHLVIDVQYGQRQLSNNFWTPSSLISDAIEIATIRLISVKVHPWKSLQGFQNRVMVVIRTCGS